MKRLLLPLLAALALPTAVNANVDPKVAEMCMKAVDFQGCVKAFSGNENNNDKDLLIKELKKLEGRITNTSLRVHSLDIITSSISSLFKKSKPVILTTSISRFTMVIMSTMNTFFVEVRSLKLFFKICSN